MMNKTPIGQRLHISVYGKRNAGKSSLINALTGQVVSIVSDVAGTTTDPVSKAIELGSLGPCLITDTAGFDDAGSLGEERIASTKRTLERTNVALLLISDWSIYSREDRLLEEEKRWIQELENKKISYMILLGKSDLREDVTKDVIDIRKILNLDDDKVILPVACDDSESIKSLIHNLQTTFRSKEKEATITGSLVSSGDVVLLVMPQDESAPKGRLILPQVQTIRELLDKSAVVICSTPTSFRDSLQALAHPPKLIITDSQAFDEISRQKPKESLLTSFSVLFAAYKGDIERFVEGARAIETLKPTSRVLIAEACTHAPASEDIGRVKIPALLRKRYGASIAFDVASGSDYPEDLSQYDLIVHCGACMFNKAHVSHRLERARGQGIPITNYGICMAYLMGILDKIVY